MPRKRKIKKAVRARRKKQTTLSSKTVAKKSFQNRFFWTESYTSFLLGIVAVIILILFGITLIRQQHHLIQQTTSIQTGPSNSPVPSASPTPGVTIVENGNTYYIVKPDDSLWNIALTYYHDGYQWTKIAQTNNLANPSTIFTGDKLLLPNVPPQSELGQLEQTPTPTQQKNAITGKTYTVQKDDTLWDIAVRAYADGYQWTKIAQTNNLANPDLIFSGNVLQIPR